MLRGKVMKAHDNKLCSSPLMTCFSPRRTGCNVLSETMSVDYDTDNGYVTQIIYIT